MPKRHGTFDEEAAFLSFERIQFERLVGQVRVTWHDGSSIWLDADEWNDVVARMNKE